MAPFDKAFQINRFHLQLKYGTVILPQTRLWIFFAALIFAHYSRTELSKSPRKVVTETAEKEQLMLTKKD